MLEAPLAASLEILRGDPSDGFHVRMNATGVLLAGVVLWPYVRAPIALYRMPRTVFNPTLRLVADTDTLDPNVRAFIDQIESVLRAAGFSEPQRIATSAESSLTSVESLMENSATGDLVNVVAILSTRATTMSPLVTAITYRSAFADGTLLQTSNTRNTGYWPDQPHHENVVMPDVRDALELFRLHRTRVARKAATVAQTMLTRGTSAEQRLTFATRQLLDSTNFHIQCGYRKRSPEGMRLTVRGAILSAWRGLFPWKQLGQRRRQRAAAEVVRLA